LFFQENWLHSKDFDHMVKDKWNDKKASFLFLGHMAWVPAIFKETSEGLEPECFGAAEGGQTWDHHESRGD
jgi:hypothetical protein